MLLKNSKKARFCRKTRKKIWESAFPAGKVLSQIREYTFPAGKALSAISEGIFLPEKYAPKFRGKFSRWKSTLRNSGMYFSRKKSMFRNFGAYFSSSFCRSEKAEWTFRREKHLPAFYSSVSSVILLPLDFGKSISAVARPSFLRESR